MAAIRDSEWVGKTNSRGLVKGAAIGEEAATVQRVANAIYNRFMDHARQKSLRLFDPESPFLARHFLDLQIHSHHHALQSSPQFEAMIMARWHRHAKELLL